MSVVNYKIINHSNVPYEGEKEWLNLPDRSKYLRVFDRSFCLEIEFAACFIDQIQIGLMNSCKVTIFGKHKLQNNKKPMLEKIENVEKELKAIVYHNKSFQNFKTSEVTNLTINFTLREKSDHLSINYIIIHKTQVPAQVLSPRQPKPERSKYEFMDEDNSRLDLFTRPSVNFSDADTSKPSAKEKLHSRSPDRLSFLPRPASSPQALQSSSTRVGTWNSSQFYKSQQREEKLVHTNSYAGVCGGVVIWLRTLDANFEVYNEICEVLGIAVLEQPEDLVDYFICDKVDEELLMLSRVFEKQVLRIDWLLECVEKKVRLGINEFLISF